jgi:hypothetical protein
LPFGLSEASPPAHGSSCFYCRHPPLNEVRGCDTGSPDNAARELRISRETARNQLKSMFAKTDTHRQSELVALLMQVEYPFMQH